MASLGLVIAAVHEFIAFYLLCPHLADIFKARTGYVYAHWCSDKFTLTVHSQKVEFRSD